MDGWKLVCVFIWISLHISKESCNNDLGIESGAIPNNQMTANDHYAHYAPFRGRLHGSSSWAAKTGNPRKHWIQVDLGNITQVTQVATQGAAGRGSRVTKYNVKYSTDGSNFTEITSSGGGRFSGNVIDSESVVTNSFFSPVNARYIRIYPYKILYWPDLRMELYGCAGI
ncbi:lactadherin-like [Antedon mediterranea]|uniref:lactadherin-like n=1 Tax=Antedon mediterranea TaxID=105859 RepID=UPI003AF63595